MQMHRIFFATPRELEGERSRFLDLIGGFNESTAMPSGIAYVPVTLLASVRDKRSIQYAVEQNILECGYYILLVSYGWGPIERNFESDYRLAVQCAADPAMPMRSVSVIYKHQASGQARNLPPSHESYRTAEEFERCVQDLLCTWMEPLVLTEAV